jgi:benzaldehyde dehydrogenase (NAD)
VQLELGGKNAVIVLDDADLEAVASAIAFGAWFHQGQICMTTGLVIAHEKIVDALTEKLVAKAKHLPVGDPTSGQVALGPVISRSQVDRIHGIVKDTVAAGATLSAGGTFDGPFYRPTVLSGVKPGMRAFDEEVFGPVAAITPFASEDEAVALANSNEYGLSAGVFSQSVGRALALGNRLRTGILHINDQTVADEPHIPFGGTGASGNGTRIGGPANWEEFTNWQWVTIKDKPNPYPF